MRARLLLPALLVVPVLAGCGGSSSPSSAAPESAGSAAATGAAPAGGASPASRASSAATPTAAATQTGAVVRPPGAAPVASHGPAPAAGASSTSTAPGKYTYDNSGTVTAGTPHDASGTSTLTVDPPANGRQHSTLDDGQGTTEQDVVVRSTGTYLARLVISNPAFTKEFRPSAPVLLVPDPAPNGRTWSWTATSTDGKTTAHVSARAARRETLQIGGKSVATLVVTSTLRLSGDVSYDAQMDTWYDPADRLTAKEHTKGSGTVSGLHFTSDITRVLRSTRPS